MNRTLPGLALILVLIVLLACGGNKLHEGTVVDKRVVPEHHYTTSQCVVYKDGLCQISVPIQQVDPAKFQLQISGFDGDGKHLTEWHTIGDGVWNVAQLGDTWSEDRGLTQATTTTTS